MELNNLFFDLLIDLKIPEFYAEILNIFLVSILILFSVIVINFISKKIIINFLEKLSKRSKTDFDNFLIANNIQIYLARLVPVFYIYWIIPFWLENFQTVLVYALLVLKIYFIFLLVSIIRNFLNATKDFFRTFDSLKGKPIESFVQVAMLFVWFTAVVLIFSIITGTQVSTFLTAMGALSAVIMLIFKDTILGFVASIQLSSNDLIRIGDWVTMKKFGADGDVIEINLNSVKIQNFDKTITTIPTYKLISDSFTNWRGMSDSDGRRIKRALLIKGSSIRFIKKEEVSKLKNIKLLSKYIAETEMEIENHNFKLEVPLDDAINGRNLTNIGLFRKYIEEYLIANKLINTEMTVMCRQLSPTSQGVPLEIYAFISDKEWKSYENIVSDIFDHLLASLKTFDLELFELPSNLKV
ncbi:mechanosensitive ion channel family protein [Flavobacteriaceae bacterium]|jgi:miniconductance mechanosensitive channel|nr:mechanosensitive ion channel family protein [Flavobacteriaceae bacterium]MDA9176769.1 mechanosensitive ion channel family protein [Flavobacteriaceae bacterium]MDB0023160.1 mechanosensitive ion channel family protein [Flavobacteriaceae bacterium]MDB9846736.1 mechanosensitive ion channel family protein [Flavobacteriaceae bacterium]MDC0554658.1 mechanosensitive ion channel family protein [Flavobacteriaceae bacterium]|tara:strand:- start:671 stop:1906 length:1236 start_codon:yes stop_codon:yes gene_type:complete